MATDANLNHQVLSPNDYQSKKDVEEFYSEAQIRKKVLD